MRHKRFSHFVILSVYEVELNANKLLFFLSNLVGFVHQWRNVVVCPCRLLFKELTYNIFDQTMLRYYPKNNTKCMKIHHFES